MTIFSFVTSNSLWSTSPFSFYHGNPRLVSLYPWQSRECLLLCDFSLRPRLQQVDSKHSLPTLFSAFLKPEEAGLKAVVVSCIPPLSAAMSYCKDVSSSLYSLPADCILAFLEIKRPVRSLLWGWPQAFSAAVNSPQYFGVSVLNLGAWWWIMGLNIKALCCLFSWNITPFCVLLYSSQGRWIIVLAKHSAKIILWITSIVLLIFIKFFPFSFDYF